MNPSFNQENDYDNIAVDIEYQKYQHMNNKYNDVVKVKNHIHGYKENEYDEVDKVEQPTYEALQKELRTQQCKVSLNKNLFIANNRIT